MNEFKDAVKPQEKVSKTLDQIRKDLDQRIAEAMKLKNDPLSALKKAADDLEKLIKDQTATRDQTKETAADKELQKTPALAKDQRMLAKRTEQLRETPLPTKDTKESVDKTKDALDKAGGDDRCRQGTAEKAGRQRRAQARAGVKALDEAKKQFAEKIAELEKRKDDIAKLEDAAKKLAELAKAEPFIADKAKEITDKSDQHQRINPRTSPRTRTS